MTFFHVFGAITLSVNFALKSVLVQKITTMTKMIFPHDFIFGAATAAYQIEGAVSDDGRGDSIWDTFSHKKGKIRKAHNGDQACDHYHRFREDIALMRELKLDAYRFSISWSRILPDGTGEVNQAGIDHYSNVVDALLEAGITPYVTLFHWDMPQSLDDRYGGFLSRQAADDFAAYVEVVVKALGDRVKNWITLNEPWEHGCLGYFLGQHAPGKMKPWRFLCVMHNQLLAHGKAVNVIRKYCADASVGITLSFTPITPKTTGKKDLEAASLAHEFVNAITLDPLLKGHYPKKLWDKYAWFRPSISQDDWQTIGAPLDFIGINNYSREIARYSPWVPVLNMWIGEHGEFPDTEYEKDGVGYTSMGWEIYPEGLYEVLRWFKEDYGNPKVYVTENGAAFNDVVHEGQVSDDKRINFLSQYLNEVQRAIDDGSNLHGYFAWSLLDNFEWAAGYDKRFGLIHVDYDSKQRTIKKSGYWYRALIEKNKQAYLTSYRTRVTGETACE